MESYWDWVSLNIIVKGAIQGAGSVKDTTGDLSNACEVLRQRCSRAVPHRSEQGPDQELQSTCKIL